jgi:hypothetical protein
MGYISRRTLLAGFMFLPLATACTRQGTERSLPAQQNGPLITVYKSPT